ncbi:MAG: competence/damage-inducible protein A [Clostridiales bacterium]|nr:competence/damage-inducible protein A [Clostridiales bacterium]
MRSAILSVGTELLFGQVTNTNTVYLSQKLNFMGIDVMHHETIGDNPERMKQVMHRMLDEVELIITTGGLGPTQDDLTKEMAAEVMGCELKLDQASLDKIKGYFDRTGRVMTENNVKQAWLPVKEDGIILPNNGGTAPGCIFEKNGKAIICLPGPPREMTKMFEESVLPYLQSKTNDVIFYRMLRIFGIGESQLESMLEELITGQTDPTIATYAKEGEVSVRVTSKRKTMEEAEAAVDAMVEDVKKIIGDSIYSYDDEDLKDVVAKKLMEKGLSISCAESCTGGLFAATLIGVDGISSVFERGFVTYSNEAKEAELGVRHETLEKFGAVSEETAREMTAGLKKKTGSNVCISVTGIAGPSGGTEEKPVGLVYICADVNGKVMCNEYKVRPVSRNWIRSYTVMLMLNMINRMI